MDQSIKKSKPEFYQLCIREKKRRLHSEANPEVFKVKDVINMLNILNMNHILN